MNYTNDSGDYWDYDYWEDYDDYIDVSELEALKLARRSMVVVSLVFFSITFVFGIPGNALVIWIAGVKMKKTVTNIWYVNLAVADLLCCLAIPFLMSHMLLENWPYGAVMCKLLFAVLNLNMYASVFTLTMISLYRFTLVIWPVWAQKHRSISRALLFCGLAWFLALILSLPELFDNHLEYNYLKLKRVCVTFIDPPVNKAIITRQVFGFLIPLLVMTVCYLLIGRRVSVGRFKSQRSLRIMVGVVMAFLLCWMPYHTVILVMMFGDQSSIAVALVVSPLAISLAWFNSCLNPVLYVFMGQDFKKSVRVSLCHTFEKAFREDGAPRGAVGGARGSKDTCITVC